VIAGAEKPQQATPTGTAGRARRLRDLAARPGAAIFLILSALIVLFSVLAPQDFPTFTNARSIATDASILLVLAVGATFVIVTAGIDLSVGSVLVFSGVISAKAMDAAGGDSWGVVVIGVVVAVAAGAAWGLLNGLLVARARVPSFVVTLGTLGAALGLSYILTSGLDVRDVPSHVTDVGLDRVAGIPWLVIIAVAVALLGALLLSTTRFGRHTYAIGASEEASRRASIHVEAHLAKIYTLAGALTGVAGFLSLARYGTTTIGGHATDNLQAITAVVIGGTSLFGGIGTVLGTVAGVFIPVVLQNGFVVLGVLPYWQQVAVGAVLIIAVYLDQLRRRRAR
jgi:ribose transport system permease protein